MRLNLAAIETRARQAQDCATEATDAWPTYWRSARDCVRLLARVRELETALGDIAELCDVAYAEPGDLEEPRQIALKALKGDGE